MLHDPTHGKLHITKANCIYPFFFFSVFLFQSVNPLLTNLKEASEYLSLNVMGLRAKNPLFSHGKGIINVNQIPS